MEAPEDSFIVRQNNKVILDLITPSSYVFNDFFVFPIELDSLDSLLTVEAVDINQDKKFPSQLCIKFGPYSDLRWDNSIKWFFRTGANLYSAYFLVLISFFLAVSVWLRSSKVGLSLLIYSAVSSVYLISFSEYPRALLDPVLATGGFHFPLRLIQDLCLVLVFYSFYQKEDSLKLIKKLAVVYGLVNSIYILLLIVGIKDYIYFSRIIILMAPLVAAPMAVGTFFAFKLKDKIERKILIPVSIALLIFQLNDLFVFWGVLDGYYTVRIYIPFIVGMMLFLYFRRMHVEVLQTLQEKDRQKTIKEFVHDVRSPLSVLKTFFLSQNYSDERKTIIDSAFNRIEGMISNMDSPFKEARTQKLDVFAVLKETISQKGIEYPDLEIVLDSLDNSYIIADKSKIIRIFSNIINNAYDSYSQDQKKILNIGFSTGDSELRVRFQDKGCGIPKDVLSKLLLSPVTTKTDGKGIGLSSAHTYVKSMGGSLDIVSKKNYGTTIEIKFVTALSAFESNKQVTSEEIKSPDFILIDDDKYVRLSWEYFARNANKKVITYSCVDEFLKDEKIVGRNCPIYLDLNINGEKSSRYIDSIYQLGFHEIIIASGEDIELSSLPPFVKSISGKLPPLQ